MVSTKQTDTPKDSFKIVHWRYEFGTYVTEIGDMEWDL